MKNQLTKRELKHKQILLKIKEEKKLKRLKKREEKILFLKFVKEIKERDKYRCQVCEKCFKNAKPQALQMAHILSKENYPSLKMDSNNVLCLCYYHHNNAPISSHLDGFAFTEFFKNKFPDRYNYLLKKMNESKILYYNKIY